MASLTMRAQPLGRGDRGAGALADHRLGDPPGEPLLAVLVQDAGELGGRVAVDDLGGGALGGPVHPHVQRGVLGVGESARRGRRAAGTTRPGRTAGPWTCRHARAGEDGGDLVVPGVHQRDPVGVGGEQLAGRLDRGHVGVDADQEQARAGLQQRAGVTGPAQGGVHQHGALGGQGGREQGRDTPGHDRYVLGPVHVSLPFVVAAGYAVPRLAGPGRPHPLRAAGWHRGSDASRERRMGAGACGATGFPGAPPRRLRRTSPPVWRGRSPRLACPRSPAGCSRRSRRSPAAVRRSHAARAGR